MIDNKNINLDDLWEDDFIHSCHTDTKVDIIVSTTTPDKPQVIYLTNYSKSLFETNTLENLSETNFRNKFLAPLVKGNIDILMLPETKLGNLVHANLSANSVLY